MLTLMTNVVFTPQSYAFFGLLSQYLLHMLVQDVERRLGHGAVVISAYLFGCPVSFIIRHM